MYMYITFTITKRVLLDLLGGKIWISMYFWKHKIFYVKRSMLIKRSDVLPFNH